jgi:hypothetical protein
MLKTTYDFIDTDTEKAACRQGETFRCNVRFLDKHDATIDLTGWTARMQARLNATSPTTLFELTTENGGLEFADEVLKLFISDTDTSAFPVGKYKYDIEIISPSGDVGAPLSGKFQVTAEITR